jgi:hypothetical protein
MPGLVPGIHVFVLTVTFRRIVFAPTMGIAELHDGSVRRSAAMRDLRFFLSSCFLFFGKLVDTLALIVQRKIMYYCFQDAIIGEGLMSQLLKPISNLIAKALTSNVFYRSLALGIVFAAIMTLLLGSFVGAFQPLQTFPWLKPMASDQYWIGILFVVLSLVFAFGGFLSDLWSRDDILSPIRRKLVGDWSVRVQTWKIANNTIELEYISEFCTIGIDDFGRKLFMHFEIKHSDVFSNANIDVVNINIQYQTSPMKLMYFYEADLELKKPLSEVPGALNKVIFPVVAVIEFKIENEKINKMSGVWYDIDNSMYSLALKMPGLVGIQALQNAVSHGSITFRGTIEFDRWHGSEKGAWSN